jgi:isoaspartyl peptidase/L-asparaginase-like protein (Ntn-hydrolase superfamily)
MTRLAVLTHGGAGASAAFSDGPERAAKRALALLAQGEGALRAALEAAIDLEDDPRFNAGTGSNLRLDGATIEMDASVMTSDGRSGAVANLAGVKNPVLVAAEVRARTPHLLLAGEGALRFARRLGFAAYDPATERAKEKLAWAKRGLKGLEDDDEEFGKWRGVDLKSLWNFEKDPDECLGDTIGALARDASGNFAAAASTGGTLVMLRGRIGDTPLIGCGLYAGPAGAVTATGVGEEIARRFLSKTVYDWIAAGVPAQEAAERGIALFPQEIGVGILALSATSEGRASNRDMPSAAAVA